MLKYKMLIPLQFFAAPDSGGAGGTGGTEETPTNDNMFTQSQVDAFLLEAGAKSQQKILASLGFDSDADYESTIAAIRETLDSGKSQQQKDQEARKEAEKLLRASQRETSQLKIQLAASKEGVLPECLEDVVALATAKTKPGESIEGTIQAMKTQTQYSAFFASKPSGTGGVVNPPRRQGSEESLGKRLAGRNKAPGKSTYFHN